MPYDGPTVYRALRRELDVAQDEVQTQRADAARMEGRLRDLAAARGNALLELARFSLPEMTRPAIEQTLDQARGELLGLLAEKQRFEAGLHARRDQAESEIRRLDGKVEAVTGALNEKVQERERLEAAVANALKADADFQSRSGLAAKAEEDLHRDERRVEELRAEAKAKLPAFQGSALFNYLVKRRYGTPEYPYRGLTRRLDRWVARLIDFPRARIGYEFLTRTPKLVEAEVTRRRELFEQLMQQVEALEKAKSDELGLTAVLAEGDALGTERDQFVASLDTARRGAVDLDRQLADLGTASDPYYRQALERLQRVLANTETRVLELRASQTPEPEDDELVARVRSTENEVARVGIERARLAERARVAEQYNAGLQDLTRRFQSQNFDSVRSRFDAHLDLASLLEGLRRGGLSSVDAWRSIERSQEFEPHRVGQGGGVMIDTIGSPQGRILIDAIGSVLGEAMREAGQRGVHRRSPHQGGGTFQFPSAGSSRPSAPPAPAPATRPGGFTTIDGF